MSNSLNKYKPVKMQGRPLVLTSDNKLQMFDRQNVDKLKRYLGIIFKKTRNVEIFIAAD